MLTEGIATSIAAVFWQRFGVVSGVASTYNIITVLTTF
jgi:hypothetical protein